MRSLICLVSALVSSAVVAQDHRLTAARLDGDVLRLQTTNGLQVVRHFQLPNPPRVVLDLFGLDGSLAEMPALPSTSPALEVRTGEHPEFLRVVVDLKEALPTYQVRQQSGSIEVGLGSAALPPSSTGVMIEAVPDPGTQAAPPSTPAPVVAVGVEASPGGRGGRHRPQATVRDADGYKPSREPRRSVHGRTASADRSGTQGRGTRSGAVRGGTHRAGRGRTGLEQPQAGQEQPTANPGNALRGRTPPPPNSAASPDASARGR